MKRLWILAATLSGTLVTTLAIPAPSVEAGATKAATCQACHGATGKGNEPAKFPALRGQQSSYVAKQLTDYASGTRATGPNGIMQTIAKRLSPDDIRSLASYVQGIR